MNIVTEQSNSTVIIERGPNVMVEGNNIVVTQPVPYTTTTVVPGGTNVISLGIIGPPGPQGPAGPPAAALQAPAGSNLNTLGTVIVLNTSGELIPADPTNINHATLLLGMSISTGSIGDTIQYLTVGEIAGMTGLTTGQSYWLGLNGSLSTSYLAAGATWFRFLGNAQSTTSFILDKQPPVTLS